MLLSNIKKAWLGSIAAIFVFTPLYFALFELLEVDDLCRWSMVNRLFHFFDCQHILISACLIMAYTSFITFFVSSILLTFALIRAERLEHEAKAALIDVAESILNQSILKKKEWLPAVEKAVNDELKNNRHITLDAEHTPKKGKTTWILKICIDGICFQQMEAGYIVATKDTKYNKQHMIVDTTSFILNDYHNCGINSHIYKAVQAHTTFNATMNPPAATNSQVSS